ncbi:MAG: hypothetical protein Q9177_005041 [Variospora cf. flavescens]
MVVARQFHGFEADHTRGPLMALPQTEQDPFRRIRHIKCDETKPACKKCTSTGRQCDGYVPQKTTGAVAIRQKDPTDCNTVCEDSWLSLATPTYWSGTVDELRAFEYFRIQTSEDLAYSLNSSMEELVLQTSHHHEAIRHAAIALGSLGETICINSLSPGCGSKTLFWERHDFACTQYYKSVRLLQQDIGRNDLESVNFALISCFLFVVFEFLQGNDQSAVVHLRSGLKIFRQQSLPTSNHVKPHTIQAEIARIFRILDTQLITWCDLRTFAPNRHIPMHDPISREMVPESFDTLDEASDQLRHLISRVYRFRRDASKHDSAPTRAQVPASVYLEREALLDALDVHRRRLGKYLAGSHAMARRPEDHHRITVLRINRKVTTLMLATYLEPHESLLYAESQPHFWQIVSVAALTLRPETSEARQRMMGGMHANVPCRRQVFDFFAGLIQPLYFTAIKCPDRETAMKAIELLEIQPWHEGSWDSAAMARTARRRMQQSGHTRWTQVVPGEVDGDGDFAAEGLNIEWPMATDPLISYPA